MTCAYDMRIKLWNLDGNTEESEIRDHTDEVCSSFSICKTLDYTVYDFKGFADSESDQIQQFSSIF